MCKQTGLSMKIGKYIGEIVSGLSQNWTILVATAGISITTGFTSNVSTATVFLPILGSLAEDKGISVDYLMVPAAIACSYAFILPISTAPNAIAFSTGKLQTIDMVKAGTFLNILLVIVTWSWTQHTPIIEMAFGEITSSNKSTHN